MNDPRILHDQEPKIMNAALDCHKKNTRRQQIRNWLIIPVIGGFVIGLFMSWNGLINGNYREFIGNVVISITFWMTLANGNGIIVDFLDKHWTWLEHPIKRVIIGSISLLVFTCLASTIILYVYIELYFDFSFLDVIKSQGWFDMLKFPLLVTVIIALLEHGKGFFIEWRQAAIDIEKLKTENMRSRFESLKSQVNPHFLFNSLNALSSLVYDDQGKAVDFIQKLANVYRYVLDHQNDEVVPLEEEVGFLKSFVFLNKIRFGDNLNVKYHNLDQLEANLAIPPIVLQMLVENCFKHNEISKEFPLTIVIDKKDNVVSIKNNINPLAQAKPDSSGLGLNNIISRYEILSNEQVVIKEDESSFEVIVPVLTLPS
jgi:sensor histidine kinase YesM